MATTNSNVTRSIAQTAQYIVEKWTRDIEQPFDKLLQMAPLVQDRSSEASEGDTLRVPFAAGVDARAKAASTNITYDSPEGTAIALSIDKHYYSATLIEDIVKVQSSYNLRESFKERMTEAVARQVDTDLHALYASAGTTVSGGATVDDADMLSVVTAFDTGNTPPSQRRGVVGHNTKADFLGINKYSAYDQTGKIGRAVNGDLDWMGTIYGIGLYHSGNVPVSTTGRNLFFHKKAITMIKQLAPKFETEYSVDAIGFKTVLHTVYGVGAERTGSIIELTRTTAA